MLLNITNIFLIYCRTELFDKTHVKAHLLSDLDFVVGNQHAHRDLEITISTSQAILSRLENEVLRLWGCPSVQIRVLSLSEINI